MDAAAARIPDSIEPTLGWRAWALEDSPGGGLELRPIVYGSEVWPTRHPARARCVPGGGDAHRAPDPGCSCGLYSVEGPERLSRVTGRDVTVVGSVALWGTLVEHDAGFRAELAYPDRLRLVCGRCWEDRAFEPRVVAVARTSRKTVLALCEEHARGAPGTPWSPAELQADLLSAYAVDPLSDDAVRLIASTWDVPSRRLPRTRPRAWRANAFAIGMALLLFGAFLTLEIVAAGLGR